MVVLSKAVDSDFQTCKSSSDIFTGIPVVDFSDAINAKKLIVEACKEFGFFKVINHGISMEVVAMLESEAVNFFALPQQEKEKPGPPRPFGYGNTRIGPNGDTGWLEYLLLSTDPQPHFPAISQTVLGEYVSAVRNMLTGVLDMISEELRIGPTDFLGGLIGDEKSDSCFRLNHYPPCPDLEALSGRNLIGFGEHTDPQIMSVLRSSDAPGLEICLKNGSWASVPSDQTSFYFSVGDCLQVMSNGRFKSVKHRVVSNCLKSRLSMVYFGGPPLSQKIRSLIMEESEESLYHEFTWSQYKKSAYNSKLGDNRLKLFEKNQVMFS
ncbi:gibberellin 2-beta-dioxygenase-like [Salvia miltiorrhiza]|uniref:gibberellin 2-beta-dioxygenase-like n=1 Tax=Salvia miltiorrhiza TaxID=226208 RepID=UPI0025AD2E1F|nr:gibberellin 2-beta-dioxygenase-like [Salvia miltiorrhiza]